jgi:hypothetical protein
VVAALTGVRLGAERFTLGGFAILFTLAGFSVASSIDFTAVWIDLIAFNAVRLLAYPTDLAIAAPFPAIISKLYLLPRLRSTNFVGISVSLLTKSAIGRT